VSYCRFGDDSDVYLYPGDGDWECCGCRISVGDDGRTRLESLPAVLAHLEAHRAAGHKVPDHAFSRVRHELTTGRTIFGRPIASDLDLDGSSVDLSVNDLAAQSGIPAKEFTEPGPLVVRVDPRDQLIGAALAEYTDDDEFKRARRKIAKHA
jgi:hypothetical protein